MKFKEGLKATRGYEQDEGCQDLGSDQAYPSQVGVARNADTPGGISHWS